MKKKWICARCKKKILYPEKHKCRYDYAKTFKCDLHQCRNCDEMYDPKHFKKELKKKIKEKSFKAPNGMSFLWLIDALAVLEDA